MTFDELDSIDFEALASEICDDITRRTILRREQTAIRHHIWHQRHTEGTTLLPQHRKSLR